MAAQRAKPVSARVPDPRTTPRAEGIAIPRLPSDQFTGAFAFPSSCVCTAASTPPTAIPAPPQVSAILKYGKVLRPAIGISLIGPAQVCRGLPIPSLQRCAAFRLPRTHSRRSSTHNPPTPLHSRLALDYFDPGAHPRGRPRRARPWGPGQFPGCCSWPPPHSSARGWIHLARGRHHRHR